MNVDGFFFVFSYLTKYVLYFAISKGAGRTASSTKQSPFDKYKVTIGSL